MKMKSLPKLVNSMLSFTLASAILLAGISSSLLTASTPAQGKVTNSVSVKSSRKKEPASPTEKPTTLQQKTYFLLNTFWFYLWGNLFTLAVIRFVSSGLSTTYTAFSATTLSTYKPKLFGKPLLPILLTITVGFVLTVILWRYGSLKTLGCFYPLVLVKVESSPNICGIILIVILSIVIMSWLWHGFSIRIDKQLGAIMLGTIGYLLGGVLLSRFALINDINSILCIHKFGFMLGVVIGGTFSTAYEDTFYTLLPLLHRRLPN